MKQQQLRKHIIRLAQLPEDAILIVSAFFNLEEDRETTLASFTEWVKLRKSELDEVYHAQFDKAAARVHRYVATAKGQSASCHIRLGEHAFEELVTYQAKMKTCYHIGNYPLIYPLVELKDKFQRFVLVTTAPSHASIIEISIGAASIEAIATRAQDQERSCKEWARHHYINHSNESNKIFIAEKIAVIEHICQLRNHDAIIMAGEKSCVKRLKLALPEQLSKLIIEEIPTGVQDSRLSEVLKLAVRAYAKTEQQESMTAVNELYHSYQSGGLAAIGARDCYSHLFSGQAEKLIVASELPVSTKEPLVKLAIKMSIEIETVSSSFILESLGGVGVMLKSPTRDSWLNKAAV